MSDPTAGSSNSLVALTASVSDRYRIERELGRGGMATVYLAHDIKHDRKVALKVLDPDLGAVLGAERFLSEIRVTANLQHPNLLPLFDSGEANGLLYYVMPFVDGENLRQRIDREKQLSIEAAVGIAVAVTYALAYAHERGVIHRDLKPENILFQARQPVVADFGIALAVSNAGGQRVTQTGLSVGTPQYMSPEQAVGDRGIDARADIYALGAVLYEMLTGEPPHTGTSAQAVIAKLLTEEVRPVTVVRRNVPPHVDAAVRRALEKLPADRFENAKDFAAALTNSAFLHHASAGASAAPSTPTTRRWVRDATFGLAGAAIVGAAMFVLRPTAPSTATPVTRRFQIDLPDSVSLPSDYNGGVALSNDGSRLAFECENSGARAICLRKMDDPLVQIVRGTEGGVAPTFSPKNDWLLIRVGTAIKRVPIAGGTPQTVVADAGRGAQESSWGDNDRIAYVRNSELRLVSPDGSNDVAVARRDTTRGGFQFPEMLPGGRFALVSLSTRDSIRLGVISLEDGVISELGIRAAVAHYAAPDHIIYVSQRGALVAPFSLRTGRITGPSAPLIQSVHRHADAGYDLATSRDGTIAYVAGEAAVSQSMYVVDRDGKERPLRMPLNAYKEPRISPDGKHIAVRIGFDPSDGDVWIGDLAAGTLQRLTSDNMSYRPEWMRDGSSIVYLNGRTTPTDSQFVFSRPFDASAPPVRLAGATKLTFAGIALGPRGRMSVVRSSRGGRNDLQLAPTDSLSVVRPFVKGPARIDAPRVSVNGTLVAYSSNEAGPQQVYVRQIPGPGPVLQVSVNGGTEPIWSSDGSTLFYRGPRRMMAATIAERPRLVVTHQDSLFVDIYRRYAPHSAYDVFPNGRELLMTRGAGTTGSQLFVITSWQQMIGKASRSPTSEP
jgi:serine/threonine protein kinase